MASLKQLRDLALGEDALYSRTKDRCGGTVHWVERLDGRVKIRLNLGRTSFGEPEVWIEGRSAGRVDCKGYNLERSVVRAGQFLQVFNAHHHLKRRAHDQRQSAIHYEVKAKHEQERAHETEARAAAFHKGGKA